MSKISKSKLNDPRYQDIDKIMRLGNFRCASNADSKSSLRAGKGPAFVLEHPEDKAIRFC